MEVIKTIPKKATAVAVAETSTITNKGCYHMKFFTSTGFSLLFFAFKVT